MKIGFSGSHCTGKTTVINKLYDEYFNNINNVSLINEVARGFCKDDLSQPLTQHKILAKQVHNETMASLMYDIVLSDRTIVDNIAYHMLVCGLNNKKKYIKLFGNWIRTYDIIFFTKIDDIPLVDDGFRYTNISERVLIEDIIKNILDEFKSGGLRVIELSGDIETRYKKVLVALTRVNYEDY